MCGSHRELCIASETESFRQRPDKRKEPMLNSEEKSGAAMIADASVEKQKLRKSFRRFDIFFFLICALVGVDTIGSAAKNGPQGFTWLVFLGVVFFVPYALITAELG